MPKNPEEFKNIRESFNEWTIDIIRSLPKRTNKTYKNAIKKFFTTYLDFSGKLTKKSLGELSSKINKKRKKINEYLYTFSLDYLDLKKEYNKINYTVEKYIDQRSINILTVSNDLRYTHNTIISEKTNNSNYRHKMYQNMKACEHSLKSQFIFTYNEVCKYESTLKLLKILSVEVDYLLSFF